MSNSRKKVIVRRFTGALQAGYLPMSTFVRGQAPAQAVELLDLAGRIIEIPLAEVKSISYVRDFNLNDTVNPERLLRRTFLSRPRTEGVWLRLTFTSGDQLEGLAATDISFLDSLIQDAGLHLSPPDIRSNTQHIFVPRSAITDLHVLAVITTPSKPKALAAPSDEQLRKELQENLFEAPTPPNSRPN